MPGHASAERPPDPRRPGAAAQCFELPHKEFVTLEQRAGGWTLRHSLTGEVQPVEVDGSPKLHFSATGHAYISSSGTTFWANSLLKCSAWALHGQDEGQLIVQKLKDDAVDIKWFSEWQDEFVPTYFEVLPHKPAVKVLTFKTARFRLARFYWCLFHLAMLLDRSDASAYTSAEPEAVQRWLTKGIHKWRLVLEKHHVGEKELLRPSMANEANLLEAEGALASTKATLFLLLQWLQHLQSASAQASCEVIIEGILRQRLPEEFELQIHPVIDYMCLPPGVLAQGTIVVTGWHVDLAALSASHGCWKALPLATRKAIFGKGLPTHLPLHRWLGALMLRPYGHWLLDQLVPAIAAVIDRHWDPAVDIFAPLQKSIAQYAHRCDPALRRAAFLATRAKQGSQKLSRAAKVLGKSASLRNRLHMHCEMHCYFMEFRRVFSSAVQLAVAPDDSRFHGKAYCMSPVQDLVTGIMGWLPPKAQALEQYHRTFPECSENFLCGMFAEHLTLLGEHVWIVRRKW